MDLLTATAIGSAIGLATGLVPGLHVNTLAVVGLGMATTSDMGWMLLAAGTVHTIVNIVPATYLGAPDEDDVLVVLPAHRLMLAGMGPTAIRVSVASSLLAILLAASLTIALPRVLARLDGLDAATCAILLAIGLWLIASERRRAWAVVVFALAGCLGWWSAGLEFGGSYLLPLLAGMFGAAGLVASAMSRPAIPEQARGSGGAPWWTAGAGTVASLLTALMPGLTASVAGSLLPRRADPRHGVAVMSAINSGHAVLAIGIVQASGRVRTGLADVVRTTQPLALLTMTGPTTAAIETMFVILAAAAIGGLGTVALGALVARHVHRVSMQGLAWAGGLVMAVIVFVFTGGLGLLLFAASAALGLVPIVVGVRRVQLVGCLLIPALIRNWP